MENENRNCGDDTYKGNILIIINMETSSNSINQITIITKCLHGKYKCNHKLDCMGGSGWGGCRNE